MADKLKNLVPRLGKRGPHRVLTGELEFAGIPGRVYTPEEGKSIPGVAFGHDWRMGAEAYHATMRHLASWGIAVAAPDTEKGFMPNHRGFASDLETALQILSGVRLGTGNVRVNPNRLFLAGDGMGGSAAVLAAADREAQVDGDYASDATVAGVISVFPADATPSPYEAAKNVMAPGLVIGAGALGDTAKGDPRRLAANWQGDVVYRELEKSTSDAFHENYLRKFALGMGRPEFASQELIRGLMTGFILAETDKKYRAFRSGEEKVKGTKSISQLELFKDLPEHKDTTTLLQEVANAK